MQVAVDTYSMLAALFSLAAALAWISKKLGLSYVAGYVLAGIALSFLMPAVGEGSASSLLNFLSDIAIALLAFEIGREVGISSIRRISVIPLLIGLGELLFSFVVVTVVGLALKFDWGAIIVLTLVASSCSTAITYKLMEERGLRGDMRTLIFTVGAVEDIITILALTMLPQLGRGLDIAKALETLAFSLVVAAALILMGLTVVKSLFARIVKPDDFGLAVSISLSFAYALISRRAGLSPALGAFAAGLALSAHPQHNEISEKMKPIREVFLIAFFVTMGVNAQASTLSTAPLAMALGLSVLIVVTRLLSSSFATWMTSGYKLEDALKIGLFTTTIGEFSLIITYEATRFGVTSQPVFVAVAISTIMAAMTSSLATRRADQVACNLAKLMPNPIKLFGDQVSSYVKKVLEGKVSNTIKESFIRVLRASAVLVLTAFAASSVLYAIDAFIPSPYSPVFSLLVVAVALIAMLKVAKRLYTHADNLSAEVLQRFNVLNIGVRRLLASLIFLSLMSIAFVVAVLTSSQYIVSLISRVLGPDVGYTVTSIIVVGVLALVISMIISKLRRLLVRGV
ncbi:MAG: hypothetical protein DRJ62_01730 [Thermoprotei archaeon]|nr:MAG: hypothetical protein DRJ62_01730 [Thermoprotei archaeon]